MSKVKVAIKISQKQTMQLATKIKNLLKAHVLSKRRGFVSICVFTVTYPSKQNTQ